LKNNGLSGGIRSRIASGVNIPLFFNRLRIAAVREGKTLESLENLVVFRGNFP